MEFRPSVQGAELLSHGSAETFVAFCSEPSNPREEARLIARLL